MKKQTIIISGIIVVLAIIMIAFVGIFFLQKKEPPKTYRAYIEEGKKYLVDQKYDEAIASFEAAIALDETSEEAYIELYEVYIVLQDFVSAHSTLERGYEKTNSAAIYNLISQFELKYPTNQGEETAEEEIKKLPSIAAATVDVSVLRKFAIFNHTNYVSEFGNMTSCVRSGSDIEVEYQHLNAKVTYKNFEGESDSIDEINRQPMENARPSYLQLEDLSILFGKFEQEISYDGLCKLVGGQVFKETNNQKMHVVRFQYNDCKIEIETDESGNIQSSQAWNRITPSRPTEETNTDKVMYSGTIIDATSGAGVEGATIKFSSNDNNVENVTAITDSMGAYEAELESGAEYNVEITKESYITEKITVKIIAKPGENMVADTVTISPELMEGEIRIVLTWGTLPEDLDSHLTGRTNTGDNIEVAYYQPIEERNGNRIAELDIDDTTSYGPETTTIYAAGTYEYSVYNFSNNNSQEMTESGAEVKVYMPGQSTPEIFNIPAGEGRWWHVFRIENGQIIPINQRSDS